MSEGSSVRGVNSSGSKREDSVTPKTGQFNAMAFDDAVVGLADAGTGGHNESHL